MFVCSRLALGWILKALGRLIIRAGCRLRDEEYRYRDAVPLPRHANCRCRIPGLDVSPWSFPNGEGLPFSVLVDDNVPDDETLKRWLKDS